MDDARQIGALVKRFRDERVESGQGEETFSEKLQSAFVYLERRVILRSCPRPSANVSGRVLLENVEVLVKCKIDSPTDLKGRLRLYTRRSDLTKLVRECSANMGKALQLFNVCRTLRAKPSKSLT